METTCDYCKAKPRASYQRVWVRWAMTRNGDYVKNPSYEGARELNDWDEPVGEDNIQVCPKHEEELLNGEIEY